MHGGAVGTPSPWAGLRRRLVPVDDLDPRVAQGVFAVLFAVDLLLRVAGTGPAEGLSGFPLAGLAVVLAASAGAVVLGRPGAGPRAGVAGWAVAVLAVADVGALGLSRMDAGGGATGTLAVLPALWLGQRHGARGAVLAVASTVLLVALPGLLYLGTSGANLSRSVLIPVVSLAAAATVSAALERVRASRDAAERQRRDLEAALETIEHQRRVSQAIFDTVDVGLIQLDAGGRYVGMNRRHADFMRLAYPEGHGGVAGQTGAVYGGDGVTPMPAEEMPTLRATRGEEFADIRLWVGTDPLTRRALSVSARAVRDDQGRHAGAALAYKDVTDFMRALTVKDQFVASVSHELRTPLTSIVGYVQLLQEREDLPPDVLTQLDVVGRNAHRLHRLVADLLHTAQADQGGVSVVRAPTDLAGLVRDCLAAAEPAAARSGLVLELEAPETLVVPVDAERLGQVVDNLVSNAVKYSRPGGRVQVVLGVDGDRVELRVRDQGIGIAAADRDRLFSRFFRAREAAERSIQGVGLGLSITKEIVESHGGRIEVASEPGRGSEFVVRLPLPA